MDVTIHTFADVDPSGAHVVAAFPSVGLVATIAATYLVEELGLEQVGVVDSPRFPTISVVENGEPMNPIRIYAGKDLTVFLSEFQPSPDLVRPVSAAIIRWAREQGCASVVTPEGLLEEDEGGPLRAAASTVEMRARLVALQIPLFQEGIVAGVTGVMLNLGKRDQFPVIGVLSPARQGRPDARSAAAVVDAVARLVQVEVDTKRLLQEAAAFDRQVDGVQRRVQMHGESVDGGMFG